MRDTADTAAGLASGNLPTSLWLSRCNTAVRGAAPLTSLSALIPRLHSILVAHDTERTTEQALSLLDSIVSRDPAAGRSATLRAAVVAAVDAHVTDEGIALSGFPLIARLMPRPGTPDDDREQAWATVAPVAMRCLQLCTARRGRHDCAVVLAAFHCCDPDDSDDADSDTEAECAYLAALQRCAPHGATRLLLDVVDAFDANADVCTAVYVRLSKPSAALVLDPEVATALAVQARRLLVAHRDNIAVVAFVITTLSRKDLVNAALPATVDCVNDAFAAATATSSIGAVVPSAMMLFLTEVATASCERLVRACPECVASAAQLAGTPHALQSAITQLRWALLLYTVAVRGGALAGLAVPFLSAMATRLGSTAPHDDDDSVATLVIGALQSLTAHRRHRAALTPCLPAVLAWLCAAPPRARVKDAFRYLRSVALQDDAWTLFADVAPRVLHALQHHQDDDASTEQRLGLVLALVSIDAVPVTVATTLLAVVQRVLAARAVTARVAAIAVECLHCLVAMPATATLVLPAVAPSMRHVHRCVLAHGGDAAFARAVLALLARLSRDVAPGVDALGVCVPLVLHVLKTHARGDGEVARMALECLRCFTDHNPPRAELARWMGVVKEVSLHDDVAVVEDATLTLADFAALLTVTRMVSFPCSVPGPVFFAKKQLRVRSLLAAGGVCCSLPEQGTWLSVFVVLCLNRARGSACLLFFA